MPPPSSLVGRSTGATQGTPGDPKESKEPKSFEELLELFRKKVEYSEEKRKSHPDPDLSIPPRTLGLYG